MRGFRQAARGLSTDALLAALRNRIAEDAQVRMVPTKPLVASLPFRAQSNHNTHPYATETHPGRRVIDPHSLPLQLPDNNSQLCH